MSALVPVLAFFFGVANHAHAADIGTEETLGAGVTLGSPTGVTGKFYFAGPDHALDFGVATEFLGFGDDRATIYATYLFQPGVLFAPGPVSIPWHIGAGAQLWTSDLDQDIDPDFGDDAAFGIRIPVGLDANLKNLPLQVTGDVAPVIPIIPSVEVGFELSLAVRYYFL